MKNLLAIGEAILLVSGITLVVKGTIDIYDKTKNKIVEAKHRKELKEKGYEIVD